MNVSVTPFGEQTILITWPPAINERTHQEVFAVNKAFNTNFSENIIETVPSYHSIAVFINESENLTNFIKILRTFINGVSVETLANTMIITIPVCYEEHYALDLKRVSEMNNLSADEVITLHSTMVYPIYFLGFLPGFPYLAGLDEKLHTPRLETPRLQITAGAVGIGGSQTGIYPEASPGGWNIIGRTPIKLFNVNANPPNLLEAGDFIQFKAISQTEFEKIAVEVSNGTFRLKTTVL